MPGTPGSHALVTNAGWLYSVGENRIGIYSLGKTAPQAVTAKEIKDFKPALRPTLGADGSLYAMPSGTGYIYAYTTSAQESWRYPDTTKLDLASALSLSPEAGRYVYALTKVGNETRAVRIESATGQATVNKLEAILGDVNKTVKKLDLGFTEFHRPVVSKATKQDYVILSAATAQNGMLLAQSDGAIIWWQEGPVSQPIVNRDQNVVAVQNGKLHVYAWSNGKDDGSDPGKAGCSSEDGILQTTSNLVLDGEDNVYFLNGGTLYGYTKTCKNFLSQALPGLAQVSELMFALDGTLFARTANNNLYTITPSQPALTLGQDNLRTDTIYSAEAIKVLNNVKVEKAMRILLKAQTSISFGPGFKVEKGASIVARTGW